MSADPLSILLAWHADGVAANDPEPDAMVLSTATVAGRVSSRVVLFRGMSGGRLRFFTNYESRKGRELESNPHAALLFHWAAVGRQARVEGTVEKLGPAESDEYFSQRPRGNQLQALSSPQSRPIESLDDVRRRHAELVAAYAGKEIVRPQYWGGYGLTPTTIELWTRGEDRLHLRRVFDRSGDTWLEHNLAP